MRNFGLASPHLDVKAEFTLHCGPSVKYLRHEKEGRGVLRVWYTIPAVDEEVRSTHSRLRNGTQIVLRGAAGSCASQARTLAYSLTGHRDADMKHLLSGKIL